MNVTHFGCDREIFARLKDILGEPTQQCYTLYLIDNPAHGLLSNGYWLFHKVYHTEKQIEKQIENDVMSDPGHYILRKLVKDTHSVVSSTGRLSVGDNLLEESDTKRIQYQLFYDRGEIVKALHEHLLPNDIESGTYLTTIFDERVIDGVLVIEWTFPDGTIVQQNSWNESENNRVYYNLITTNDSPETLLGYNIGIMFHSVANRELVYLVTMYQENVFANIKYHSERRNEVLLSLERFGLSTVSLDQYVSYMLHISEKDEGEW